MPRFYDSEITRQFVGQAPVDLTDAEHRRRFFREAFGRGIIGIAGLDGRELRILQLWNGGLITQKELGRAFGLTQARISSVAERHL